MGNTVSESVTAGQTGGPVSLSLRHALATLVLSASVLVATPSPANAATAAEVDGEIAVPCWIYTYQPDANVTALQTLAVNWASGTDPSYHPGGAYYQSLLSGGVIETLSGN
jgi:hypothetical protein